MGYRDAVEGIVTLWQEDEAEIERLRQERTAERDGLSRLWNSFVEAVVDVRRLEAELRPYVERHSAALLEGDEDKAEKIRGQYQALKDRATEARERREDARSRLAEQHVGGDTAEQLRRAIDARLEALKGDPPEVREITAKVAKQRDQIAALLEARSRQAAGGESVPESVDAVALEAVTVSGSRGPGTTQAKLPGRFDPFPDAVEVQ